MRYTQSKYWRYFGVFLAGLLLVAAYTSGIIPAHIEVCEGPKESGQHYCSFYPLLQGVNAWINANEGLILSLATIIIAVFTVRLWSSTRNLWIVTRQTVDNLVATERARFFVVVGHNTFQAYTEFFARGEPDTMGSYGGDWVIPYSLKNYGKTPAIIRETSHFLINTVKPPDEPTYFPVDIVEGEFAISADQSTKERFCFLSPESKIGQQEAINLFKGETSLWFYGRVLYDDVLGGAGHEHCWLWKYNGTSKGFRPCYDYPNYIKNT